MERIRINPIELKQALAKPARKVFRRENRFSLNGLTIPGSFSCLSATACGLSLAGGDYKVAIAWGMPSVISTAFTLKRAFNSQK